MTAGTERAGADINETVARLQSTGNEEFELLAAVAIPHAADEVPVPASGDLAVGEAVLIVRRHRRGFDPMLDVHHLDHLPVGRREAVYLIGAAQAVTVHPLQHCRGADQV